MLYDTIEFKRQYTTINDVLYWLVEQAKTGVPYCREHFPKFQDPQELYEYMRGRVTYHDDPPGVELIQSPGTLFEDNYFGKPGHGDCDCFVTLLLSCCWSCGFKENYILLYGRSKSHPSHISMMTVFNGKEYIMDLTEKKFNHERHYPFVQEIPVFK